MCPLKLVQIGDFRGLVLAMEGLNKLKHGADKLISPLDTTESQVLSAHGPVIQDQLKAGREFIRDYRDALDMLGE